MGWNDSRTASGAAYVWKLRSVPAGETLNRAEAGQETSVEHTGCGQTVGIRIRRIRTTVGRGRIDLKELCQASGRAAAEGDRQNGCLEGQLIDRAHVFTHEVVAVSTADRGVVMAEDVPGKANARAEAGGVRVLQRRI